MAKKKTETASLIETFAEFKENKNIDYTTLVGVLEESFRNVIAKIFGSDENFDVIVNPDKGDCEIYRNRVVVADEELTDPNKEIALSEAQKIDPDYEEGEEVAEKINFTDFGRRAILTLRQTLASKVLELEHDALYNKYKDRIGELIAPEVYQTWKSETLLMDEERNELYLPKNQQIPRDFFHNGDTVQAVIDTLCPGAPVPEGAFLSMEGLDGSGKTTQIALLTSALEHYGFEVQHSREPGGCPVSEAIRGVLLSRDNVGMTDVTEALLYAASRAQHVHDVIRPAVAAGRVLLCDRFVDSSVAYQGGGRQLGVQKVLDINAPAIDNCLPMNTVYLDIDHRESLRRRCAASEPDRMEMEADSFHARVEAAYKELIARDPARFVVVDATGSPEDIGREIAGQVLARLMEAEA